MFLKMLRCLGEAVGLSTAKRLTAIRAKCSRIAGELGADLHGANSLPLRRAA